MRKLLLLLMLLLLGFGGGGGLGWYLRPEASAAVSAEEAAAKPKEYMKFPREFVIPLLEYGRVTGMIVLQLGLEVPKGQIEAAMMLEPRLRDELLRVLFEHANAGGFRGNFTGAGSLDALRRALLEAAQKVAGPMVRDVLITDLARQEK